jgi:hypothetical protein
VDGYMDKEIVRYTHTYALDYYLYFKNKEILSRTLCSVKISQTQKRKQLYDLSYVKNLKKESNT